MSPQDLIDIKNYSNKLCRENGFIITEAKTRRNENPKWKQNIRFWALKMMQESYDMEEFIWNMSMHGIDIKYNSEYKYMTYTDSEGHRCRDAKLFDERLLKPIIVIDGLNDILKEQKAIGRNLNQLTTLCNMGKISCLDLSELITQYSSVYERLNDICGRCE